MLRSLPPPVCRRLCAPVSAPLPVCGRLCAAACGEYTTRKARMQAPCTPVADRRSHGG